MFTFQVLVACLPGPILGFVDDMYVLTYQGRYVGTLKIIMDTHLYGFMFYLTNGECFR